MRVSEHSSAYYFFSNIIIVTTMQNISMKGWSFAAFNFSIMLSKLLLFFFALESGVNCEDCLNDLRFKTYAKATNPCKNVTTNSAEIQQPFLSKINFAHGKFARNICFEFLQVIVSLELAYKPV